MSGVLHSYARLARLITDGSSKPSVATPGLTVQMLQVHEGVGSLSHQRTSGASATTTTSEDGSEGTTATNDDGSASAMSADSAMTTAPTTSNDDGQYQQYS